MGKKNKHTHTPHTHHTHTHTHHTHTTHTPHTHHTHTTRTHTHKHTQTHTNTHKHTQTHTNTHKHTQTHTNTHKHTQTHTHKPLCGRESRARAARSCRTVPTLIPRPRCAIAFIHCAAGIITILPDIGTDKTALDFRYDLFLVTLFLIFGAFCGGAHLPISNLLRRFFFSLRHWKSTIFHDFNSSIQFFEQAKRFILLHRTSCVFLTLGAFCGGADPFWIPFDQHSGVSSDSPDWRATVPDIFLANGPIDTTLEALQAVFDPTFNLALPVQNNTFCSGVFYTDSKQFEGGLLLATGPWSCETDIGGEFFLQSKETPHTFCSGVTHTDLQQTEGGLLLDSGLTELFFGHNKTGVFPNPAFAQHTFCSGFFYTDSTQLEGGLLLASGPTELFLGHDKTGDFSNTAIGQHTFRSGVSHTDSTQIEGGLLLVSGPTESFLGHDKPGDFFKTAIGQHTFCSGVYHTDLQQTEGGLLPDPGLTEVFPGQDKTGVFPNSAFEQHTFCSGVTYTDLTQLEGGLLLDSDPTESFLAHDKTGDFSNSAIDQHTFCSGVYYTDSTQLEGGLLIDSGPTEPFFGHDKTGDFHNSVTDQHTFCSGVPYTDISLTCERRRNLTNFSSQYSANFLLLARDTVTTDCSLLWQPWHHRIQWHSTQVACLASGPLIVTPNCTICSEYFRICLILLLTVVASWIANYFTGVGSLFIVSLAFLSGILAECDSTDYINFSITEVTRRLPHSCLLLALAFVTFRYLFEWTFQHWAIEYSRPTGTARFCVHSFAGSHRNSRKSGPKSRRWHWHLSFLCSAVMFSYPFFPGADRGEGCTLTMGGAEASWPSTFLPTANDAKLHGSQPPMRTSAQMEPKPKPHPKVVKRSLHRAQRRAHAQGMTWYRGRCMTAQDFLRMGMKPITTDLPKPKPPDVTQCHHQMHPRDACCVPPGMGEDLRAIGWMR